MVDRMVPLSSVMAIINNLCSDCQAEIRKRLAIAPDLKGNVFRDKMSALLEKVSDETGIPIMQILERSNNARLVEARRKFCVLARAQGYSYPEIGAAIGKHHTTIIHLVNKEVTVR
jgi:chromosomal replication initiation ATPase DnaA